MKIDLHYMYLDKEMEEDHIDIKMNNFENMLGHLVVVVVVEVDNY